MEMEYSVFNAQYSILQLLVGLIAGRHCDGLAKK